jgi:hypothetical protein
MSLLLGRLRSDQWNKLHMMFVLLRVEMYQLYMLGILLVRVVHLHVRMGIMYSLFVLLLP